MAALGDRDKERLDILAGERSAGSRGSAAVRLDDLTALLSLPSMKSRAISGSPTPEEYNALRRDLIEVHERLRQIAEVIRGRKA